MPRSDARRNRPSRTEVVSGVRAELRVLTDGARLLRRAPRAERGAVRLSYGSGERVFIWILLPCALIELVVMDYLLRNTPLRVPVLVLGLLTFPFALGLLARTKAFPHLLYDDRLVLRSGADFSLQVPLDHIRHARRRTAVNVPDGTALSDGLLVLARSGQTDLRLVLEPAVLSTLGPVERIDVALDDPQHPALHRLLTV